MSTPARGSDDLRGHDLRGHGLRVAVPPRWEGRIFRRSAAPVPGMPVLPGAPTGTSFPVIHLATVTLAFDAADYGGGIVERLGPSDAFLALKEFDPTSTQRALFARHDLPHALDATSFDERVLQRRLPRQSGMQRFFSHGGRAFSLYAVIGSHRRRHQLATEITGVLRGIEITPARTGGGV